MPVTTPARRAVTIAVAALLGGSLALAVQDSPSEGGVGEDLPRVGGLPTGSSVASPPFDPAARPGRPVPVRQAALPAASRVVPPRTLLIPSLGIALPVRPTGVDDQGLMALPDTVRRLGWYRFGAGPLDPRGATVIAGHVDTVQEGTGPLARLAALRRGDEIRIDLGRRVQRYEVVAVTRVAKSALDSAALFSRTGPPLLQLVTCGGSYLPDQGGYQDNLVVTARPSEA